MTRRSLTLVLVALAAGAGCGGGTSGTDAAVGSDPGDPVTTSSIESTTTTTITTTTITTATTTTTTTTTTTAPPVIQSDIDVTYSPAPVAAGSLLVHDRSSVLVLDLAADPVEPQVVLGPLDGLIVLTARLATDGSLVVELTDDVAIGEPNTIHKIVHLGVDGSIVDLIDDAALFDVAEFGGVEQVLVGELPDGEVEETNLVAVPLDGRPPVAFGTAFAPEYGVSSIDVVDGVAIVSAYSDLTEDVSFTNAEGEAITRPSPTDGLVYGAEPSVSHATFSPDGSEVAWIEGPEHYVDIDADEATWHGGWRVRSFDAVTGEERVSQPFVFPNADPFTQLVSGLAHTGDRLAISRTLVDDGLVSDLELLVLDLTAEEPEMYELSVIGVADVVG